MRPPIQTDGPVARPFLKWAGGKRWLIPHVLAHLPPSFSVYHEPFLGGGALFFGLRPSRAVLSDRNERLIRTYRAIRVDVDTVIDILRSYPNERRFFLQMRGRDIDRETDAELAAWLIYLNKTGYNGLYRVNSRNVFNVPFGKNRKPRICDEANLRACSLALRRADLKCEDFSAVVDRASPGDLVYFDPPYMPVSSTSDFTSYTANGFGPEDHTRLRDAALALKEKKVFVLLSNSSAEIVRELYSTGFKCIPVLALRAVNSDPLRRGPVLELLIV